MSIDERWTRPEDQTFELLKIDRQKHSDDDLRIQSCFLYEYARSSVKCVEDVQLLREAGIILPTTIPGLVGDSRKKVVSLDEYSKDHVLPIGDFERVKLLTFVGRFEGFPESNWDSQPEQVEDSLVDVGSERLPWIETEDMSGFEVTTNPSAVVSPLSRIEEKLELWIDWRFPDARILEILRARLKEVRPSEYPEPDGHKSNYCVYAGTNFPFRFLSALEWLSVRRKAASLKHVPGSSDFWESYFWAFKGRIPEKDLYSVVGNARQQADKAATVLKWFSDGGWLIDPGRKGRIQHVVQGKSL